jgi:hypothetical protein
MSAKAIRANLLHALLRMRSGVQAPYAVDAHGEPTVGLNATAIQGEDAIRAFHEAMQHLEALAPALVFETGARMTERVLVPYVASGPTLPTDTTIDKVLAGLQKWPAQEWKAHIQLPGALLEHTTLRLGPFTLWRFPDESQRLTRENGTFKTSSDVTRQLQLGANAVFVEIAVRARFKERAYEIAEAESRRLRNVMLFIEGYWSEFLRRGSVVAMALANDTESGGGRFAPLGGHVQWKINESAFLSPTRGHDRIWALLDTSSRTEMEMRIVTAVDWVGRGLDDFDATKGFVQFMFAFEALLNYESDRSSRFAPALGHGMSEIAAFVLGADASERKATWSRLKALYGIRSAIAHGAPVTVTREHYADALQAVKDLIAKLLTDPTLKTFGSLAQLREWTTDRRFA